MGAKKAKINHLHIHSTTAVKSHCVPLTCISVFSSPSLPLRLRDLRTGTAGTVCVDDAEEDEEWCLEDAAERFGREAAVVESALARATGPDFCLSDEDDDEDAVPDSEIGCLFFDAARDDDEEEEEEVWFAWVRLLEEMPRYRFQRSRFRRPFLSRRL
jgi:hypothetical protein